MKIADNEIHLWFADQNRFSLSELTEFSYAWLTETEQQRFQRYQRDASRFQFLLGRFLMRSVLSQYIDLGPAEWKFDQNKYGKPAIKAEQNSAAIYFNLSHSSERAVLAVSTMEYIGVDIESNRKDRRVKKLVDRYFGTEEVKDLLALDESQQQARFYELWTLKEAYIKACGLGLAIPLQQFNYGFPSQQELHLNFDAARQDNESSWQCWQLDGGEGYELALAVKHAHTSRIEKLIGKEYLGLENVVATDIAIRRNF